MANKEVIEIRSNITDGFNAHVQRVMEDEEREKLERQKKLDEERAARMLRFEEWKKSHPNYAAYGYANEYNFESGNDYCGGYCKIHFMNGVILMVCLVYLIIMVIYISSLIRVVYSYLRSR